jgi:hypothetical protein
MPGKQVRTGKQFLDQVLVLLSYCVIICHCLSHHITPHPLSSRCYICPYSCIVFTRLDFHRPVWTCNSKISPPCVTSRPLTDDCWRALHSCASFPTVLSLTTSTSVLSHLSPGCPRLASESSPALRIIISGLITCASSIVVPLMGSYLGCMLQQHSAWA